MSGPGRPIMDAATRAELVAVLIRRGKTEAEAATLADDLIAALQRIRVTAHGPEIDAPRSGTRDGERR